MASVSVKNRVGGCLIMGITYYVRMIKKIFHWVRWLFISFVLFSVAIVIITLLFDDFDGRTPNNMDNRAPVVNQQRTSEIDVVIDALRLSHPQETGLLLLENNLEAFAVRALTARSAQRSLDLQYYIWHSDLTGKLLSHELLKAADRGVYVRLLLDDLNAKDKDSMLSALAEHPNIEIRLFNPVYSRQNFITRTVELIFRGLSLNRRMHNKAWIVDENIAIIGGRNIGDEYFDANLATNFFDVDVFLAGLGVTQTAAIFERFWNSKAVVPFKRVVKRQQLSLEAYRQQINVLTDAEKTHTQQYFDEISTTSSIKELLNHQRTFYWTKAAEVYSDPPEKVFDKKANEWLLNNIFAPLAQAQHDVYLISPYFVPGDTGVAELVKLKNTGVNIRVLTNSLAATDVFMVHGGYAPYRKPLLKAGIELFELMPVNRIKKKGIGAKGISLHTKMFIIDQEQSFIGSFNLDPRSARLNTEMGILFKQEELTAHLLALYAHKVGMNNSYRLFLTDSDQLRWIDRAHNDATPDKIWLHEPETPLLLRMITKIVSWLPIESQL